MLNGGFQKKYQVTDDPRCPAQLPCLEKKGDTVWHLKEKIVERVGFPPDQQRLIHKGKILVDSESLAHYGEY